MTAESDPLVTVVAVGNTTAGDDAAAPAALTLLAERWRHDPRVRCVVLDGEPARILDAWRGSTQGWLIDAMITGAPPGTVVELDVDRVGAAPAARHGGSHAAGVGDAIGLGRALGWLPDVVRLFGIEGRRFAPGDRVSDAVAELGVPAAVDAVDEALRRTLDQRPAPQGSSSARSTLRT